MLLGGKRSECMYALLAVHADEMVGEGRVWNDALDAGHVARDAAGGWIDRAGRRMRGFGQIESPQPLLGV